MGYPTNYDSFVPIKKTGDIITEVINIPASAAPITVFTTYPILRGVSIPGYVEVVAIPATGQFRVYYKSNQIVFGPTPLPVSVTITYITTGTPIADIPFQAVLDAITAIEKAIGLNPGGTFSTLADRLIAIESSANHTHKVYDGTGAINGTNIIFTLPDTPSQPEATIVVLNGSILTYNTDYIISGADVVFSDPPSVGDTLIIYYAV